MAILVTVSKSSPHYKSWTVTAGADSDSATAFAHGLVGAPDHISITPTFQSASTLLTFGFGATADATNIYLVKGVVTGSAGITAGTTVIAKVVARVPHTFDAT